MAWERVNKIKRKGHFKGGWFTDWFSGIIWRFTGKPKTDWTKVKKE